MDENIGMQVHSAKALMEHHNRKEQQERKSEAHRQKHIELASNQVILLEKSNALASQAIEEAREAKADSEKSGKKANISNIIAAISLIVAVISLVKSFL